ncbi:hypothetical protein TRIUR3_14206 [Triticum urartu]|uniref:Uncharacterized protein n=1 Tax=Triticum urartu TaxID=4572 RepID=M8ABG5_TRIUA|nr:hypothetical protein TRIUR3_14206 [Triticum urartu]
MVVGPEVVLPIPLAQGCVTVGWAEEMEVSLVGSSITEEYHALIGTTLCGFWPCPRLRTPLPRRSGDESEAETIRGAPRSDAKADRVGLSFNANAELFYMTAVMTKLEALKAKLEKAWQEVEQQKATGVRAEKELAEERAARDKDQARVLEVEETLNGVHQERDAF